MFDRVLVRVLFGQLQVNRVVFSEFRWKASLHPDAAPIRRHCRDAIGQVASSKHKETPTFYPGSFRPEDLCLTDL